MMERRAAVNGSVTRGNEACPYGKSGMQRKKETIIFSSLILSCI
jgi:hypothetical protein